MHTHHLPIVPLLALALSACNGPESLPDPVTDDSGSAIVDDDTGGETCTAEIVESEPEVGDQGWYYRDPMTLKFNEQVEATAVFTAFDAEGAAVELAVTFDETGLAAAVIPASGTWTPSTPYNVGVLLCGDRAQTSFSTSSFGEPLISLPSDLAGNVYFVDMAEATYTQPPGVGTIISQFLTEPLLIGVVRATSAEITIVGAQGLVNDQTGEVTQDLKSPTWAFGTADFTDQPYFSAVATETSFSYGDATIPAYDFNFEGTFTASADRMGGLEFVGLGDTRQLGRELGLGSQPDAACEFLGTFGVDCQECPDGNDYCVTLAGYLEDAPLMPGFTVE